MFVTPDDVQSGLNSLDWIEFRIIHTGQHDGDGSGLTFQAVHALWLGYRWDTRFDGTTPAPNGFNCTLHHELNGGSIFYGLPSGLRNVILPVAKKYNTTPGSNPNGGSSATVTDNVWLISITELVSNVAAKQPDYWSENSHQGSTYAFWNSKDLLFGQQPSSGSEQQRLLYAMNCDRDGTLIKQWNEQIKCAVRSVSPSRSGLILGFSADGTVIEANGIPAGMYMCVSPCFAL